jgi:hypothetical protein
MNEANVLALIAATLLNKTFTESEHGFEVSYHITTMEMAIKEAQKLMKRTNPVIL